MLHKKENKLHFKIRPQNADKITLKIITLNSMT